MALPPINSYQLSTPWKKNGPGCPCCCDIGLQHGLSTVGPYRQIFAAFPEQRFCLDIFSRPVEQINSINTIFCGAAGCGDLTALNGKAELVKNWLMAGNRRLWVSGEWGGLSGQCMSDTGRAALNNFLTDIDCTMRAGIGGCSSTCYVSFSPFVPNVGVPGAAAIMDGLPGIAHNFTGRIETIGSATAMCYPPAIWECAIPYTDWILAGIEKVHDSYVVLCMDSNALSNTCEEYYEMGWDNTELIQRFVTWDGDLLI